MSEHYKFVTPQLPYDYNAMAPFIDQKTMELHHDRHLQAYIDNLNNILAEYPEYQKLSLQQLLLSVDSMPKAIQSSIANNAGGAYNHIFFFDHLQNPSTQTASGNIATQIDAFFGSFHAFKTSFTEAASSVFGSGYAWLVLDSFGRLKIITTANQDTPLPLRMFPLLNLDVWEHAYYLKHYNVRADYIEDWFHIINWNLVNENLISYLSYLQIPENTTYPTTVTVPTVPADTADTADPQ